MNNKLIGAVPGLLSVAPGRVPVEPEACLESDYPEIEFWHKVTWKSTRRKQSQESYIGNEEDEEEDDKQGKMRGNSCASKGINVSMRWVEEKNGEIIDGYRATYIRGFAFGLLFELLKQGKLPLKWSMASNDVKIWFYTEMARQIPELRYCADHWKTQEIATTIYPGWISRHGGGSAVKTEVKTEDDTIDAVHQERSSGKKRPIDNSQDTMAKKRKNKVNTVPSLTVLLFLDYVLLPLILCCLVSAGLESIVRFWQKSMF